jgi:flagellar hook assembly protein FlgD
VKTIEKDVKDTGRYKVIWDGTNENHTHVATGVYFYRVLAGNNYAATKKMLLLK